MNGSNHLDESDRRPLHLCPVDLRKLHHSVRFDINQRYRALVEFTQQAGFEDEQLRETFSKKAEEAGGKLTITPIMLKVIAAVLKVFPQFNASFDAQREEIILKKYCNVGVAVDTDRGLLVPVIRDVDKKNILDLSVELTKIADKARNKRLSIEEMQGAHLRLPISAGLEGLVFHSRDQ
jgi:pyruvate/2-oxoglutarate dehydrogenase complex dihydrolipoamide acyltransferase (E2) component